MEPRPAATDPPVEPEAAPPTGPEGVPASAADAAAGAPQPPAEMVARRQFFLAFSRDTARAAVQVAGMAVAFQRGTGAAAGELLGLAVSPEETLGRLGGDASADRCGRRGGPLVRSSAARSGSRAMRSCCSTSVVYPGETREIRCSTAAEIAAAMRERRVVGAPVLGQVAAYGVWRGAVMASGQTTFIRLAVLHNAAESLRHARRHVGSVGRTTRRVTAAWEAELERTDDDVLAAGAARREADAIASETTTALTRITALGAAALAQPDGRPLEILTLGSTGALAGGPGRRRPRRHPRDRRAPVGPCTCGCWRPGRAAAGPVSPPGSWAPRACRRPSWPTPRPRGCWSARRSTRCSSGRTVSPLDGATTAHIGTLALADLAQRHERAPVGRHAARRGRRGRGRRGGLVRGVRALRRHRRLTRRRGTSSDRVSRCAVRCRTSPRPSSIGAFVTEAGVLAPPFGPALAAGLATAAPAATGAG